MRRVAAKLVGVLEKQYLKSFFKKKERLFCVSEKRRKLSIEERKR